MEATDSFVDCGGVYLLPGTRLLSDDPSGEFSCVGVDRGVVVCDIERTILSCGRVGVVEFVWLQALVLRRGIWGSDFLQNSGEKRLIHIIRMLFMFLIMFLIM